MSELRGCGCAGGQELAKVVTPKMSKPATGNKTGKAPKPQVKDGKIEFKK